jgi:inhibitor of cysteine peptidase
MKRLVLIGALALDIAGCATQRPAVVTAADDGRVVHLRAGQVLIVELDSNRTTGYRWTQVSERDGLLARPTEPVYSRKADPRKIVGAGGTEVWRFTAMRPGQQTLRMEYRRPSQRAAAPARVVSFQVVVP